MSTPLPKELKERYALNSGYFVYRKPFLINAALTARAPNENHPGAGSHFETELANRDIKSNDVFIGIAGLKALDLLSLAGKSTQSAYQHAVLFDVNERQLEGMRAVLKLIKESPTALEFIEKFAPLQEEYLNPPERGRDGHGTYAQLKKEEKQSYHNVFGAGYQPHTVRQVKHYLLPIAGIRDIPQADGTVKYEMTDPPAGLNRMHSWLQKDNYKRIRDMVMAEQIEIATMDLRDNQPTPYNEPPAKVQQLIGWLAANQLRVGDCYVSSLLSFADPYQKYDYYSRSASWSEERRRTHDFFGSLLALTDEHSRFIISEPTKDAPFLHTYHLKVVSQEHIRHLKNKLPYQEPPTEEKKYEVLFNAGGQVWRLAGFLEQDPATGINTTKYFRIFSEGFAEDRAKLDKQIEIINKTLKDLYRQPEKTHNMMFVTPDERLNPPLEKRFDTTFFEYQKNEEGANVILSSNPFAIRYDPATQDPAQAIEALIRELRGKLHREELKIQRMGPPRPPAAPKEPLEIHVNPAAIKAALERGAPKEVPGDGTVGRG